MYNEFYDKLSYTAEQKAHIAANAAQEARSHMSTPHRSLRLVSRIAAAAVLLVSVFTITAEAVGIPTPVSEILAPIFGGTVAQTEVIDKIGRPIDAGDTDNGVTIRAEAIIGDEYNACIVFSISRDDGTPLLPQNVTAEQLRLGGFCSVGLTHSSGFHGTGRFRDSVPGDSEIQYIQMISSDEPLNKGTAKIEFDDLSCWDEATGESIPVVEGRWKFRFDVDYDDSSVRLGSGETFRQDDMNFTITDIQLSPVGIRVAYEVDSEVHWSDAPSGRLPEEDRRQTERYMEDVEILLIKKDGTAVDMSITGGSLRPENGKTYCTKSTVFSDIYPLEDWEALRVGGINFPIG